MNYTIKVTAEDIASGTRNNGGSCPIALALRRYLPSVPLSVGSMFILYGVDETQVPLPKSAQRFIGSFDKGLTVSPFSFRLQCPLSRT